MLTDTPWVAHGPDPFGDFNISSEGEQLAKCVVVQNGFRTPEETAAIATRLIKAVNNHDALVKALQAACGYLLNAKIDLSTGCTKATAIRTIEGGLKQAQAVLDAVGEAA